jgi:HK97 family phage prohead protease
MTELVRSFALDADEVDVVGRRLEGRALAWDTLYKVSDDGGRTFYDEGWRRGSTLDSIRARRNWFEARDEHADVRVGYVGFAEADDGLVFNMTLDLTPEADDMIDKLRNHQKDGVSVRYTPILNKPRGGPPFWRTKVELRELSLTNHAQYADARVHAIRSQGRPARTYQRPDDIAALLTYEVPDLS